MQHDIIIVGAGPAGLSTWLHLNALAPELAQRTLVLEKAVHPRDKLCGGGVTPLGGMLLRGLGIDFACDAVGVEQIEFRAGSALLPFRHPEALRVVSRRLFDAALAEVASERGLELRQGEALVDLEHRDDSVHVRTSKGEYDTRVVVGADGVNSVVRQKMDLGDESRVARLIEIVAPVDAGGDPHFAGRTAEFDFTAAASGLQGYVWHFPCVAGGRPAVNRGIYDSRVHPERPRSDLRGLFTEALHSVRVDPAAVEWKSHPVRWFAPETRSARPNLLLVGDAAGVDALLGEGITPSLDYGDFAANFLIDAFERGDFSFVDHRERFLAHPLGRSLAEKHRMAAETYAENGVEAARLPAVMLRLLGQG